jgi:hypothetical protein
MKRVWLERSVVVVLVALWFFILFGTVGAAFAAAPQSLTKTLNFAWDQDTVDLSNIDGWWLYVSETTATGFVKLVKIPYTTGAGPSFTGTASLTVTGAPGTTVKRYFVLTANGKNATESVYSNEVVGDFVMPYSTPTVPFNLKLTITP